ncbi:MAG: PAS domain S-box protein, partial [Anaerolineae bacterium]|nr:PAS domain S-box protein [Anaerolineae bacterium]
INVIYADRQGYLWLGGWGTGLERLDPQTGQFRHYRHQADDPTSLSHNAILSIYRDRRGILWIGTNNGLNRFDPARQQFTAYYHQPGNPASLAANDVRVIYEDKTGLLWLGSWFGGLTRFDPLSEQFKVYQADPNQPHSLSSNAIMTIYQDHSGALWVGTANGLNRFDPQPETFSVYTQADGLPSNRMRCILEDEQRNLWLSTAAGLARFDPDRQTFKRYTAADGLQGNLFTASACYQAQSGEMFFGGSNGLNSFYPENVQDNVYAPPVVLTGLQIFDQPVMLTPDSVLQKPIWQTDRLALSYLQDTLSFEFAALSYISPAQNRYRYKLEGFDDDWRDAGSGQRVASYTNLDPGNYVFRVQAANNDGVWSDKELAVALTLTPPWWNTWLFRGLVFVSLLGVIVGIYRWRVGVARAQTRRLETLIDERTAELRQSQALYHSIIRASPDSIIIFSLPGIMEFVSPAGVKMFGYDTAAEIVGRPILDFIAPTDHELAASRLQQMAQGGPLAPLEYRALKKDGQIFDIEANTEVIRDVDGRPTAVLSIIRDITARKQVEEALRAKTEELDRFFSLALDLLCIADIEGYFLRLNRAWEKTLGYSLAELEGQKFLDFVHPDDKPSTLAVIGELSGGQEVLNFVNRYRCKDGSYRWIEWRSLPYGKFIYAAARDITERKQVEEALRESEARMRQITAAMRQAVWLRDTQTLEVLYVNPAYEEIWGRTCESLYADPTSFVQAIHPEDKERIFQAIQKQYQGIFFDEEYRITRPDGNLRWVWGRTFPIKNDQGEVHRILAVVEDITERKLMEEALLQAKALAEERSYAAEAANQAKSIFLANMSHELRTPLNAILGFAELMTRSPSLPSEHRDNLGIITTSGGYLLTMINQVLDLSKIEAGRMSLEEKEFDLYRLLDDLEGMFQLRAANKSLRLVFDRGTDVPQYIRTDEVKLRQVLINLLNNAVKFTQRGEVVLRVQISNGKLQLANGEGAVCYLQFAIQDTGPGIAPNELDSLFETFTQTKSGQQAQEGTGLGLTISQKFVQLMGGNIQVESEVGQGTTFRFDIQVGLVEAGVLARESETRWVVGLEPGQPHYRILIADDKKDNRQLLVKLLNPLGFDLREAENGQEAVEIWADWQPHLIWMDLRMPVMDGYEATKQIKLHMAKRKLAPATGSEQGFSADEGPEINTVIIAVTASAFEGERAVVLQAGCDDFVRKPFRDTDIFDLLHKHIGVRYVYKDMAVGQQETEPGGRPDLQKLKTALHTMPGEVLVKLKDAVIRLDVEAIDTVIQEISRYNAAVATELTRLATDFKYEQILALIQTTQANKDE